MQHRRLTLRFQPIPMILSIALIMAYGFCLPTAGAQTDPVDEIESTLKSVDLEILEKSPQKLKPYQDTLSKQIAKLTTIKQKSRVLALDGWDDDPTVFLREDAQLHLQQFDAEMRKELADSLRAAFMKIILDEGKFSNYRRIALANMIAELGPTIPAIQPKIEGKKVANIKMRPAKDMNGFGRSLTDIVIKLADSADLGVKQEALRALGTINPHPDKAIAYFVSTIKTHERIGPRRVAAHGLLQMVTVANYLASIKGITIEVQLSDADCIDIARKVTNKARVGLDHADPEVRILCLKAIFESAKSIEKKRLHDIREGTFPPTGIPLSPEQRALILKLYQSAETKIKTIFNPLLDELAQSKGAIIASIKNDLSSEPQKVAYLNMVAMQTLGRIINAYDQLAENADSLPQYPMIFPKRKPISSVINKPLTADFVDKNLTAFDGLAESADVRVRRELFAFLNAMGEDAAPAAKLVAKHLSPLAERNQFVRWLAAETIANLPHKVGQVAVPNLVKMLGEDDLDVRQAAARTLLTFAGKLDKELSTRVVEGLAQASTCSDPEPRLTMMRAIMKYGPDYSAYSIPSLINALGHKDVRIRRLAALVLGSFGPNADVAIPALREALGDSDSEVRINASDAILQILPL